MDVLCNLLQRPYNGDVFAVEERIIPIYEHLCKVKSIVTLGWTKKVPVA